MDNAAKILVAAYLTALRGQNYRSEDFNDEVADWPAIKLAHWKPALLWAREREKVRKLKRANSILLAALNKIRDGRVMKGRKDWGLGDVIQEYYKICRTAIAEAQTESL